MTAYETPGRVAVLVATCARPELLRRALESVAGQQLAPDLVVVVHDGDVGETPWPGRASALQVLRNARTGGASGAWNTGLIAIQEQAANPEAWFVAVLDDDDVWEPDHLAVCMHAAAERGLHMVIAGLVRHDGTSTRRQTIPDHLDPDELLVRNPHVQGSNLFVRLDVLLRAGLFDENLRSCTDRDLCLRIADLDGVQVGSVERHTVHHYADADRPRLSHGEAKHDGLDAFWSKYRGRMTDLQREAFLERSHRLFGWTPRPPSAPTRCHEPPAVDRAPHPVPLVVGIIADAGRPERVAPLLDDLRALSTDPDVSGVDVVLLENGPRPTPGQPDLAALVETCRSHGQRVWLMTIERQEEDATEGLFGDPFERGGGRASIARARTMLQRYVGRLQRARPHAIAWILDDDKRLDALIEVDGRLERRRVPFVRTLLELRARGAGAVLGEDTDAPPVPQFATTRTALLDVHHALVEIARRRPGDVWPDRAAENAKLRERFHDLPYDLSTAHTAHLEVPIAFPPSRAGETVREALLRLAAAAEDCVWGAHPTRRLCSAVAPRPEESAHLSTLRGGHTFILDPDLLDTPNAAPTFDGEDTRRSDMVWAIANAARRPGAVVRAPLPIRHARDSAAPANDDLYDVYRDVLGHAVQAALADVYPPGSGLLSHPERLEQATDAFASLLRRRLSAFDISAWRVRGLGEAIRLVASTLAWWCEDLEAAAAVLRLRHAVDVLVARFAPHSIAALKGRVLAANPETFRSFASTLPNTVERFATAKAGGPGVDAELARQRRIIAERQVVRMFGPRPLRYLGEGCEGVVFTDDERVFKVLDHWKARTVHEQRAFLRGLLGRWPGARTLCDLRDLREDGEHAVVVYPYEPSEPYEGGHGPDLVALLRECRAHGVVCRNVHPKNLRVTTSGLRLIDYGSDIRPYTHDEWLHMARRAWLTWRWPRHPRLADLMRAALTDPNLAELDGFDRFLEGVDAPAAVVELRERLERDVSTTGARTVLDYGCGKGDLARALGERELEVVAYDPDDSLQPRWARAATPGLTFTTSSPQGAFDAVVCSLVLCAVDDETCTKVIRDLADRLVEGGRALIVVCHPACAHRARSTFHHPVDVHDLTGRFTWTKRTGDGVRVDHHRPVALLKRMLLDAGLYVDTEHETRAVDLERFEPTSDFLVLGARRVAPRADVSLVIRSCVLEGAMIGHEVRHLVRQLEPPAPFAERVLVVDARLDGFTRAWGRPDPSAFEAEVRRLVEDGVIHRVIRAPGDGTAVNERWFGIAASETHTPDGAPNVATLYGLDEVRTRYAVQVDADLLVHRADPDVDWLAEPLRHLREEPDAVSASLPIVRDDAVPYDGLAPGGTWRVEVRGCVVDLQRLRALRPLPCEVVYGSPATKWHRAVDAKLRAVGGRTLRGGEPAFGFVHPPNVVKRDRDMWLAAMDRLEDGFVPEAQRTQVELAGDLAAWLGPKRPEPYVFLVQGRNVAPGRFRRCIASMLRQVGRPWGAIVMDDASDPEIADDIGRVCAPYRDRITLLRVRERRIKLANTVWAVRHLVADPEAVIIMLDADDALIGSHVLERIGSEYDAGADMTIGSMLRTDKVVHYAPVNLEDPRGARGGFVWQHLRTFRKRVYEQVPDEYLRVDGRYVELADDWAQVVPMVELAERPVYIPEPLYLHEPSPRGRGEEREARERVIAALMARPRLRPPAVLRSVEGAR